MGKRICLGLLICKTKSAMLLTLIILALIGFGPCVFAQTIDGNLVGTVVDPTGATVPSATVEVTNTATGIKTTARTGMDGLYRFNNLPVGNYDITVTASGFAMSGLKNVAVELNKTATANVAMQVQGVTQEVAVVEA